LDKILKAVENLSDEKTKLAEKITTIENSIKSNASKAKDMILENKNEMINLKGIILNNTSLIDKFKPYFKEYVKHVKNKDTNILNDNSQPEKIETDIKSDEYVKTNDADIKNQDTSNVNDAANTYQ
jgi:sugar-specific transcriptional regulator TrmB